MSRLKNVVSASIHPSAHFISIESLKVTGYSLLINIHEKILPSFSSCRNQLQNAVEATYYSTMSSF